MGYNRYMSPEQACSEPHNTCAVAHTQVRGAWTLKEYVEVFYAERGEWRDVETNERNTTGWYWWPCFPGCLPDGEPDGPYATKEAAIKASKGEW